MNSLLSSIQKKHDEILQKLTDPALDRGKRQSLQKELSHLVTFLKKHQEIDQLQHNLTDMQQEASATTDPEMKQLFEEELAQLRDRLVKEQHVLDKLIAPPDPLDDRSVFLEIRAGTGGQEAALFVADLLKMYSNYALKKGWKTAIEDISSTDLGGYREVIMYIKGDNVYGHLKYESGVHRVQRVPATETAGRVHTSTATVAVLPEAEEVDVQINPADLRIDVFRAGGAGGQHVNKTESAVRITHIPTGIVVSCQEDRSQHKNKAKAMKILQSRILAAQKAAYEAEMSRQRKEQVGTGERAEKVRTYNFPQNRMTDHQVDMTLKNLDMVMQGQLDDVIEALRTKEHDDRKKRFLAQFQ
jgi:peptide chain release factor 1